jgi:hypothetical protein
VIALAPLTVNLGGMLLHGRDLDDLVYQAQDAHGRRASRVLRVNPRTKILLNAVLGIRPHERVALRDHGHLFVIPDDAVPTDAIHLGEDPEAPQGVLYGFDGAPANYPRD